MTKTSVQKAAFVVTKEETRPGKRPRCSSAVPIPRPQGRWFRHYALDHGLSMAELIRRILRIHGGPAGSRPK